MVTNAALSYPAGVIESCFDFPAAKIPFTSVYRLHTGLLHQFYTQVVQLILHWMYHSVCENSCVMSSVALAETTGTLPIINQHCGTTILVLYATEQC